MPPQAHTVSVQLAGTTLSFETGRIARLATAAVLARSGDSVLLATVVAAPAPRPGTDFFPLTVEYREKLAASGRIPGAFNRREGRISDHEVLVSRLIDRTVRSLFPDQYRCEVQIQVNVLSADPVADVPSLAILAACAALHLSPLPAKGPAAGLRIARCHGAWVAFPARRQRGEADLDFVVSTGPDGLVMVEGEADQASEDDVLQALEHAQAWCARLGRAFAELRELAGAVKLAVPAAAPLPELPAEVEASLRQALHHSGKAERHAAVAAAEQGCLAGAPLEQREALAQALHDARWRLVREEILATGRRLDGRGPRDIRPIWGEVGWLPRTHGSAIFTRGETQALVTCTLGTAEDAQRVEGLDGMHEERFLLHYGFPPYSVGEIRPLRGPGRREIGHGFLARRGLQRMLPGFDDFPYTIRVESEISESNGSSSMATVCGGTMALLHAGVPLTEPVAGIAMGLVTDGTRTAVLSDILGDEDHLGDMDFKVVGTLLGITALQLDNKVGGLSRDQLAAALLQAKEGRAHILGAMSAVIAAPSAEPPRHAPRAERLAIMPESLGLLVGPRGANIRAIEAGTGARVTVDDDGLVSIYAADPATARRARARVQQCAGVVRAQRCYRAVITSVKDFGAFARINEAVEGLIPIEELYDRDEGQRPQLAEGAELVVKVLGTDGRGRLRLSRRQALTVDEVLIEY